MDNVVEIKSGVRRSAITSEALPGRSKRASALQVACRQRAVFSHDDQKRAASNMHRLLDHVCQNRSLPKREIALKAGLGGSEATDSTKRFDTYTLPDNAPKSRIARLAKKPGKFLEIAEAVAGLLGEPPAGYICQVFEGCSFGTGQEFEADWEEQGWGRLAELLRRMSTAVMRDEETTKYWLDVMKLNGSYDSVADHLHQSNLPLDGVGCETGLAGWSCAPNDLPPIPSILLGQRPMMAPVDEVIVLKDGRHLKATFTLYLEARLVLAPVGQDGLPGPMIEFRSRLDARNEADGEIVFDNRYSTGSGEWEVIRSALIGGEVLAISEFPVLDAPEAERRPEGMEHGCFMWEEISPALLRGLFGDIEAPFDTTIPLGSMDKKSLPPSRFTSGTAGYYLNAYLLTGEMERDLAAACRGCSEKVAAFRDVLAERIDKAEMEAEKHWMREPSQ